MKLPAFSYHRPASLEEALLLLADLGDDAKIIAGGQSLIPLLALRLSAPAHLVDIGAIESLRSIVEDDGAIEVGAGVRHSEVERSEVVATRAPLVSQAMPLIGHRAIRNRGTACGSLAHADPAGELPAVALALDSSLVMAGADGDRVVRARDFFTGYLSSDIQAGEILRAWRVPARAPRSGWSVQEVSRRHGDYALIGAAVRLQYAPHDAEVASAAISLFGAAATPVRVETAEQVLVGGTPGPALWEEAAAAVRAAVDPPADNHATRGHRVHLAGVLTRRCLAEAADRIGAAA